MASQMIAHGKKMHLTAADLLATALELTATAIVTSVSTFVMRYSHRTGRTLAGGLYLTGGGSHNRLLRQRLSELLGGLPVATVRDLGFDPDLVEAAAFAVMGASTLWSRPLPTRFDGTNQDVRPVLGMICQPPVNRLHQGRR